MAWTDDLRKAIKESGLTHYRLGQITELSPSVIDRFVEGRRDLYLSTASRLADALGLEVTARKKPKKTD